MVRHPWSDAWVLQAIVLANRDGDGALHEVIAAADAINHALPTFAELSSGWAEGRATASTFLDAKLENHSSARSDARNTLLYPGLTIDRVKRAKVIHRKRFWTDYRRLRSEGSS